MPLKPLPRPLAEPGGALAHHLHDTGLELTSGTRRRPHQQQAAVICSVSRAGCSDGLVRRHPREVGPLSRGVISPEGSTLIRPITGRRWLPPSSSTRRPIGTTLRRAYPEGRTTGLPRSTDVSGWFRLCLSAGGSDSDDRGWETPCTWPRTILVQACPVSSFRVRYQGTTPGLANITALTRHFTGVDRTAPSWLPTALLLVRSPACSARQLQTSIVQVVR